ncbi:anthranilate phosphoribosyltransferase [Paenibacillus mesotrionivorans]|uniref:Anthranilate phosphoribosyltransferase n=1 Tax=Paenibacillus mesotrionivorans TaxID=3160968 RepID=A0ACC7PAQ5_9BACL
MISLIKEVGRGKRGSRDLTYEEAGQAAELILSGEATPVQIGAFLAAERVKMESADELLAFVHALRKRSLLHPVPGSLDCAGPYDGRTKSYMATWAVSFVVASCGVPVTLHGSAPLPPKHGVTLQEVALQLGARLDDRNRLLEAAERSGVLFVPAEEWCTALRDIRPYREQMGIRTIFHSVEKLLRFSDAPYMALGIFHGTVFEKMAELVSRLGVRSGIIIQGAEGSEDLLPNKRTRTHLVRDGEAPELYVVDPEAYDLQAELPEEEVWTAERQAHITADVLEGHTVSPYFNMVLLNSAVRLWAAQAAGSVEEGIERALSAIRQGAAYESYRKWQEAVR